MNSLFVAESLAPVYEIPSSVRVKRHGDQYIVVNPDTGGWAVADRQEVAALLYPAARPRRLAEEAYYWGIARRNGHYAVPHFDYRAPAMFMFEFNLTWGCNLACVYCSNDGGPRYAHVRAGPGVVSAFARRVVEYAVAMGQRSVTVEFTGGEPFLNFPAMRQTMEELTRLSPPGLAVEWLVQSNFTAVTDEALAFLRPFDASLGISWDGLPAVQDSQRRFADGRGSYDAVVDGVGRARRAGFEICSAYCVVTSESIDLMPELAQFFLDNGMAHLVFEPVRPLGRGGSRNGLVPDAKHYAENLLTTFERVFVPHYRRTGVMPIERHALLTFAHLMEPARRFMCAQAPCGAGRLISVTMPDGAVYPCNEMFWPDHLRLGNVLDNSFTEMVASEPARRLSERTPDKIEECRDCLYRGWCHSRCARGALARGNLFSRSLYCDVEKALLDEFLGAIVDGRCDLEAARVLARKVVTCV
jgi:uncharacterized protein